MPAYRSEAEREIRDAVVEHLRAIMPGCRIINEVNASSFGNRIDVLAVGEADMVAVEIKSSKDKLARLPDQISAMRRVSNNVVAALHERFLQPLGRPDLDMGITPPDEARGAVTWIYPRNERRGDFYCRADWHAAHRWKKPKRCLPSGAIEMLWREELHAICSDIGVRGVSKLTMDDAIDAIQWRMNGEQITRIVCQTLRARQCVEADPPIFANASDPVRAAA